MATHPGVRLGEEIIWSGYYHPIASQNPHEQFLIAGRSDEVRLKSFYDGYWAEFKTSPAGLDALAQAWLAYRRDNP